MTIQELKQYIYKNSKIEYILEKLNCHNIKYHEKNDYFSASFPDGDNLQGINIKNNEYLNFRSFSRNVKYEDGKDLIDLTEKIKKNTFTDSIKFLHQILGLEYKFRKNTSKKNKKEISPLYVFEKYGKMLDIKNDVNNIHTLDEDLLQDYIPILHIDWYKEGVMPWVMKKFGLAYSYKRKRVIIPMRYWLTGELVGINSRTIVKNYEELGIKKFYITPSYPKNYNLYGLYENYSEIQKAGYVVVVEAEKSVLKRASLGDNTLVALSGKTLSEEQIRILLGLNVEIVFALDKDVPLVEIQYMCEKICKHRKVSYMYDKWDLLNPKDSPVDALNKIYQFLFKNRIVYDISERRKYLNTLHKKKDRD